MMWPRVSLREPDAGPNCDIPLVRVIEEKGMTVKQRERQTRTGYERRCATRSQGHERGHCESVVVVNAQADARPLRGSQEAIKRRHNLRQSERTECRRSAPATTAQSCQLGNQAIEPTPYPHCSLRCGLFYFCIQKHIWSTHLHTASATLRGKRL